MRPPETFSFDGPDVGQRWTRWDKVFRTYFVACEFKKKPKDIQVAILLNCAGSEAQEIHETFVFETPEEAKDVDRVLEKFNEYCNPGKNTVYERYKFRNRKQQADEPVDKWVKDLKTLANNCEYGDQENSLIRDQIVYEVRDNRTKERMIREKDLSLEKALDICRAAESAKTQMKEMSQEDSDVHEIRRTNATQNNENNNNNNNRNTNTNSQQVSSDRQCFNCHGYGHLSRDCPSGDVFPRGRGRSTSRGNRGGRSRGRGPGRGRGRGRNRGYNVNEIEEETEEDDNAYEDQFNSLSLHLVTSESSEPGRTTVRGNQHVCSRVHNLGL